MFEPETELEFFKDRQLSRGCFWIFFITVLLILVIGGSLILYFAD